MSLVFKAKYEWALLPEKRRVERRAASADAEVYARNFRWVRKTRTASACWPWRLGQELGWVVRSPVDIEMTPIHDVEIDCPPEDFDLLTQATTISELWRRDATSLALETNRWLRLYDYRTSSGWEAMFVPNGDGTVEWHLGWEAQIPDGYYLLVLPDPETPPGLEIIMGVLDAKALKRLHEKQGMALAVRLTQNVRLTRRQVVARVILLHADSLKMNASDEA
jgi:hypothetical protein